MTTVPTPGAAVVNAVTYCMLSAGPLAWHAEGAQYVLAPVVIMWVQGCQAGGMSNDFWFNFRASQACKDPLDSLGQKVPL